MASKREIQNPVEAAGDFTGNKIADKIVNRPGNEFKKIIHQYI